MVMAPLNPAIPPAAVKVFEEKKAALIDGSLNPFGGPIKDNSGKEIVAAGARCRTPLQFANGMSTASKAAFPNRRNLGT